jgi:hypothetical protein
MARANGHLPLPLKDTYNEFTSPGTEEIKEKEESCEKNVREKRKEVLGWGNFFSFIPLHPGDLSTFFIHLGG